MARACAKIAEQCTCEFQKASSCDSFSFVDSYKLFYYSLNSRISLLRHLTTTVDRNGYTSGQ
jgi:hypothetical protein